MEREAMDACHEYATFDLPGVFFPSYYGEEKPNHSTNSLKNSITRFMNTSSEFCPSSKVIDTFNVNRKKTLNALDRISFDLGENLSCGWLILLDDHFTIHLVFFLEYEKRFVLIEHEEDFFNYFKHTPEEDYKGIFDFQGVSLRSNQDEFSNHWWVVIEKMSWKKLRTNDFGGSAHIVMNENHFQGLRQILGNQRFKKARFELAYLNAAYNSMLRDFLAHVRLNIRSDCAGCVRSAAGDMFICGRSSSRCIESLLHVCLQKKRIANRTKGLEFLYENIPHIFPAIARRLKEEMRDEENLMKKFSGGLPDYVKHCQGNERKFPQGENMDYDE
jgi:hypothetical protein